MFRFIWKIICIPLEIFRAFLIAFTQLFCLLTHRNASRVFAVVWFLGFIGAIQQTPDWGIDFPIFSVQFLVVGGVTMLVLNALNPYFWRSLRKMQTQQPLWRLKAKAIVKKPQFATTVISSFASSGETRRRMTSRLSPELQGMLVPLK